LAPRANQGGRHSGGGAQRFCGCACRTQRGCLGIPPDARPGRFPLTAVPTLLGLYGNGSASSFRVADVCRPEQLPGDAPGPERCCAIGTCLVLHGTTVDSFGILGLRRNEIDVHPRAIQPRRTVTAAGVGLSWALEVRPLAAARGAGRGGDARGRWLTA